jgi:hypothetical protein
VKNVTQAAFLGELQLPENKAQVILLKSRDKRNSPENW